MRHHPTPANSSHTLRGFTDIPPPGILRQIVERGAAVDHRTHNMAQMEHTHGADHDSRGSSHDGDIASTHHGKDHANHQQHGGHGKHAGHHVEQFRRRFWWSLLLTIPVVITSEMVMDWFGYELDFRGIEWVGPVLGSVIFLWGGWPFLEGGVAGAQGPPARDDAADRDGDHGRLRGVAGDLARPVRPRFLVGAVGAGHDHAARPLAGDEGARPSTGRGRCARRAAARRRRARRRRRLRRARGDRRAARRAMSCWFAPVPVCRPTV